MRKIIFILFLLVGACAPPMISLQAENIVYSERDFYRLASSIENEWGNMNFPNDVSGCLTKRTIHISIYPKEEFIEIYGNGLRATTDARHEIAIRQDFYEEKAIDAFVHELLHIAEKCALNADINDRLNHTNYLIWDRNNSDSLERRVTLKEIDYLESVGIEYTSYIER